MKNSANRSRVSPLTAQDGKLRAEFDGDVCTLTIRDEKGRRVLSARSSDGGSWYGLIWFLNDFWQKTPPRRRSAPQKQK